MTNMVLLIFLITCKNICFLLLINQQNATLGTCNLLYIHVNETKGTHMVSVFRCLFYLCDIQAKFTWYSATCLNETSLGPIFVFKIDMCLADNITKIIPTLVLYIKCDLYRIQVYTGFGVYRFHYTCVTNVQ